MLLSIAENFIKKPVLSTVCTIVIVLAGIISIPLLPISQLPQLGNTQVNVTASSIGSDAETTENTVTTILEREINGVDDMKYISSNTGNNGLSNITVNFPTEVDRNVAQVNVQNRVSQAQAQLPSIVKQTGVKTEAASSSVLLVLGFSSEKGADGKYIYDTVFISNYLELNLVDRLKRLPGVGKVSLLGERKYAMRIWIDPQKMAARGLIGQDIINALQEQNVQVGAGKIGQAPFPGDQQFEIPLQAVSRLQSAEEFSEIVINVSDNGSLIKLRDVGRVELGAENYDVSSLLNGEPSVGMGIYQRPGSNALETGKAIKDAMDEMQKTFPPGMKYIVAFDTTLFINASLMGVLQNLWQALALVVLIVFIFLQDWRTTLIPAVAIPVGMIGTFAGMKLLGYDLNSLTLFGLILSCGLGVDDAIVIVDGILVKIEQGMKPRQAALDAMNELESGVISSSLVLLAVFIPVCFFPGTTGVIYRQFAVTIAFTTLFSTFNAITFSPTMSALLLRPRGATGQGILGKFFQWFNNSFQWLENGYNKLINFLAKINVIVMGVFVAGLVATCLMYVSVPTGFVPEEDQGYFFILFSSPDGVSIKYTAKYAEEIQAKLAQIPEVKASFAVPGFDFDGQNPSKGLFFCQLTNWSERPQPQQSVYGVLRKLNRSLQEITGVRAFAVNAPPVQGLSSTGGFELQLLDQSGNLPITALIDNGQKLINESNSGKYPALQGVYSQFSAGKGQKRVEVFRDRAKVLNVDINSIFATLQTYLGGSYVNDFVLGQRQYRVYVQAEGEYRSKPQDINQIYVRSKKGDMVPLGNLVKLTDFTGPETITHFNIFRSMKIQGNPAPGYSSGQAIASIEQAASQALDPGFGYAWQGTALEEKSSGGAAGIIFGLAFIVVFLVLAAQYESYIDPTIILLVVPMAVLGALGAIWLRANIFMVGTIWPIVSNDVYCQVALVMLIAMAAKNSILIVEAGNQMLDKGLSISNAAIQAARSRFRPIQMTAISTLIGFWPMVVTSGAGASSNWSLGTALFGGMLMATILSLLITPNIFIAVKTLEAKFLKGNKKDGKKQPPKSPEKPPKNALPDTLESAQATPTNGHTTEPDTLESAQTTPTNGHTTPDVNPETKEKPDGRVVK